MLEAVIVAVLSLALSYLGREIDQMQKDIKKLLLDVAVLKEHSLNRRATDKDA